MIRKMIVSKLFTAKESTFECKKRFTHKFMAPKDSSTQMKTFHCIDLYPLCFKFLLWPSFIFYYQFLIIYIIFIPNFQLESSSLLQYLPSFNSSWITGIFLTYRKLMKEMLHLLLSVVQSLELFGMRKFTQNIAEAKVSFSKNENLRYSPCFDIL
jgi:hypothetical protein